MRTARMIRRGLPGIALVAAACGGPSDRPGPAPEVPPPAVERFHRDRPVFHVLDPARPTEYFVYGTREGIAVMTVEPGIGLRPATEAETRFVMVRYDAHRARPRDQQVDTYAELVRAERAAKRDFSDELVTLMEKTLRRWKEEHRDVEIRLEAASAAGAKEEEAKLGTIRDDLAHRILAHEIKIRLYTSPEWKAARPGPKPDRIPLRVSGPK